MSELFEPDPATPPPPTEVAAPVTAPDPGVPSVPKVKVKKPRKPLTEERKAQLREQLKKGRERSLAKRQAGKHAKELQKVKVMESEVEQKVAKKLKSQAESEQELEERLTIKIKKRLQKEKEEQEKENELISLRRQVAELKKPKEVKAVDPPPKREVKSEPIPVPARQKMSKWSPSQHFMGGF